MLLVILVSKFDRIAKVMTDQLMHRLVFEDQPWALADADWDRFRLAVPDSLSLGFETCMEHTANWSGRVDTYAVQQGELVLLEAEVYLAPGYEGFMPSERGVRRDEERKTWVTRSGPGHPEQTRELSVLTRTVLEFRGLVIPYTGWLVGGRDLEHRYYVHGGYQRANRFGTRLRLHFQDGKLIERDSDLEFGASSDSAVDVEQKIRRGLMKRMFDRAG